MARAVSDIQNTLEAKQERVAKVFKREMPDKVPFFYAAETYTPYYCGMTPKDITTYDEALAVTKQVVDDLHIDCSYFPYFPHNLSTAKFIESLGGGAHIVNEEFIKQINPANVTIMKPEDYPGVIADPFNYLLEEVFPRRFETLALCDPVEKLNRLSKLYDEYAELGAYCVRVEQEASMVLIQDASLYFNPMDYFFDVLRDFKGIVADVKRRPEELRDACLAMVDGILKFTDLKPRVPWKSYFVPMHIPAFLTPKDFENTYWPSFKLLTEGMVAQGHNLFFEFEVDYSHLFDYLQELPKTNIVGLFEQPNLREVKEKLGKTMGIAGGLSTNTLQYGTEDDCREMVRGLIDDLAYDGAYFLTPDKPLTSLIDAKPENLKAAADFAYEYGRF